MTVIMDQLSDDGAAIRKRSVLIAGHKTSVSVEGAFWDELRRIAQARGTTVGRMIEEIDAARRGNLSSAIRLYVLDWLRHECGTERGD